MNSRRRPKKQIAKMNRADAARIVRLLREIEILGDPRSRGHILTGNLGGLWRYRAGDWRIICRIEDERLVIVVLETGYCREIYR